MDLTRLQVVAYRSKPLEHKAESEADKIKRLQSLYRETFRSDGDKMVLFDILNECGFFSMHVSGEVDLAKNNIARLILNRLGAWTDYNGLNVVQALMTIPPERT